MLGTVILFICYMKMYSYFLPSCMKMYSVNTIYYESDKSRDECYEMLVCVFYQHISIHYVYSKIPNQNNKTRINSLLSSDRGNFHSFPASPSQLFVELYEILF